MNNAQLAEQWRKEHGHNHGVVVIFNGQATGWMNELRSPESWEPGCVAVDPAGVEWVATGGNAYDGATKWERLVEPEAKRELPEPKRGSYFILNDTLCLRVFTSGDWIITGQADGQIAAPDTYQYRPISELPTTWRPLSEVLAQAARAEELEAKLTNQERIPQARHDRGMDLAWELGVCEAKLKQAEAKAEELEAELQRRNTRIAELDEVLGDVVRTGDGMADRVEELEEKLKQAEARIKHLEKYRSKAVNQRGELALMNRRHRDLLDKFEAARAGLGD